MIFFSYPFKDEDNKGKHHWRVLAEVVAVFPLIVGPVFVGTEDYNWAPDEEGKLHDDQAHEGDAERHQTGHDPKDDAGKEDRAD